ncbi:hypothetical protein D8674_011737 [Pyrus ussuriensis x Pyrus communis]|uniref:Retrovirus-related Pol polyprotein from transposon TNT 1-94-like beta-barrel domain-containing protein n=1 Tax=Pyrus ussuriensis x Pyrus communis TaxID=2448454 RepID=A0A5N5FZJ9_9ROSA|nr:hypothetical protein D8674_011737 [Pyrus ussuriensis x Pyrus communis]
MWYNRLIYVDDMNLSGILKELEKTVAHLKMEFEKKDIEKTRYCVGLEIEHCSDGILVHQSNYTKKVLRRFNEDKTKPSNSHMAIPTLDAKRDPLCSKDDGEEQDIATRLHADTGLVLNTTSTTTNQFQQLASKPGCFVDHGYQHKSNGHYRREGRKLKKEKKNEEKQEEKDIPSISLDGDIIFLSEYEKSCLNMSYEDTTWTVDSGAFFHATSNKAFFSSYKTSDGLVNMGNKDMLKIAGIGEVILETDRGTKLMLKEPYFDSLIDFDPISRVASHDVDRGAKPKVTDDDHDSQENAPTDSNIEESQEEEWPTLEQAVEALGSNVLEKKLLQLDKVHTNDNKSNMLTKALPKGKHYQRDERENEREKEGYGSAIANMADGKTGLVVAALVRFSSLKRRDQEAFIYQIYVLQMIVSFPAQGWRRHCLGQVSGTSWVHLEQLPRPIGAITVIHRVTMSWPVLIQTADALAAVGALLDDLDFVAHTLNGLPSDYNAFATSIRVHSEPVTPEELQGLLLSEELAIESSTANLQEPSFQAFHTTAPSKPFNINSHSRFSPSRPNKNSIFNLNRFNRPNFFHNNTNNNRPFYTFYNTHSHTIARCLNRPNQGFHNFLPPSKLTTPSPNYYQPQSFSPSVSYFSMNQVSPSTFTWYADSGATNHITNNLSNLSIHSDYTGTDKVNVANG